MEEYKKRVIHEVGSVEDAVDKDVDVVDDDVENELVMRRCHCCGCVSHMNVFFCDTVLKEYLLLLHLKGLANRSFMFF